MVSTGRRHTANLCFPRAARGQHSGCAWPTLPVGFTFVWYPLDSSANTTSLVTPFPILLARTTLLTCHHTPRTIAATYPPCTDLDTSHTLPPPSRLLEAAAAQLLCLLPSTGQAQALSVAGGPKHTKVGSGKSESAACKGVTIHTRHRGCGAKMGTCRCVSSPPASQVQSASAGSLVLGKLPQDQQQGVPILHIYMRLPLTMQWKEEHVHQLVDRATSAKSLSALAVCACQHLPNAAETRAHPLVNRAMPANSL